MALLVTSCQSPATLEARYESESRRFAINSGWVRQFETLVESQLQDLQSSSPNSLPASFWAELRKKYRNEYVELMIMKTTEGFSLSELREMNAFLESPAGKKFMKQPMHPMEAIRIFQPLAERMKQDVVVRLTRDGMKVK